MRRVRLVGRLAGGLARQMTSTTTSSVGGMVDAIRSDTAAADELLATLEKEHPEELRRLLLAAAQRFDPDAVFSSGSGSASDEESSRAPEGSVAAVAGSEAEEEEMEPVKLRRKDFISWHQRVLDQAGVAADAREAEAEEQIAGSDNRLQHRNIDAAWMSHANWIARAAGKDEAQLAAEEAAAAAAAATTPTRRQLAIIAVMAAVPMVGFGFVDNLIMIVAGDAIERQFGLTLGMTALAAAGLGNAVSDVAGIFLGNSIEAGSSKLGIPDPELNKKQANSREARLVTTGAGAFGIFFGCVLGMFPLLFIEPSTVHIAAHTAASAVA